MEQPKIRAIRRYLSQNGVKYYDVQAELIDHFATAVEKIERENLDIRFKVALLQAHRSFGGREGFRKYIQQAENDVRKKSWKLIGLSLLQFIKWPYLLITLSLFVSWHLVLTQLSIPQDQLWTGLIFCFLLVLLINYLRLRKVDMFLPKRSNNALGLSFYFLAYLPGQPFIYSDGMGYTYSLIFFSFTSLLVLAYTQVPRYAIRETKKLYPKMA